MRRHFPFIVIAVLSSAFTALPARATTVWDESINGSLSASGATPTPFTLGLGTSSILGTVGPNSNHQDWVGITVPAGLQLSHLVLAAYQSTDAQGFFGVQTGTSFQGSTSTAASYLGYTHFGTAAQNGSLPATNLVGVDLLPIMGDNLNNSPGSQGFTPPLAAGSYIFLIQQTGSAATNYRFDFSLTPEPASALPFAAPLLLALRRKR